MSTLYTATLRGILDNKECWMVHQFRAAPTSLNDLFRHWAKAAVKQHIITHQKDIQELQQIAPDNYFSKLFPVGTTKNTWNKIVLLDCYTWEKNLPVHLLNRESKPYLEIIKTSAQETEGNHQRKHSIWSKFHFYKDQLENMKYLPVKSHQIQAKQEKYLTLLDNWYERKAFASCNQETQPVFYTVFLNYLSFIGKGVCQFYLEPNQNINALLPLCSPILRQYIDEGFFRLQLEEGEVYDEAYESEREAEMKIACDLLEKVVLDPIYELRPVKGLINVWSTCCMLNSYKCDILVTKTEPIPQFLELEPADDV